MIQQSQKFQLTCTFHCPRETMGNQPRAEFRMHTLALPKCVLNIIIA